MSHVDVTCFFVDYYYMILYNIMWFLGEGNTYDTGFFGKIF